MKLLLLLVLPVVCFSSCFTALHADRRLENSPLKRDPPFVRLRSNEKILPHDVQEKKDSLVADALTVAKKDVALYSNGVTTYANICSPCANVLEYKFAPRIVQGDLNIYRATWRHKGEGKLRGRMVTNTLDYIQKADTGRLYQYRYQAVKRLIAPGEPGYNYLVTYRHRNLYGLLGLAGSIGMLSGGIGILNSSHHSLIQAAGDLTIVSGACGYFVALISLSGIKARFTNRAVAQHDGL